MSRMLIAAWLISQCLCIAPLVGQNNKLTLDRIINDIDLRAERFVPARWVDNGEGYSTVEKSADGIGQEIIRYQTGSGDRRVLVEANLLIPQGRSEPLAIDDYALSIDRRRLLIYTNSQKVWRRNTRGDYWVLDTGSGQLRQLGGDAKPATLMFAKLSPDGEKVGYVRENNVYVEDVKSGKITALTTDGSSDIVNGTSDWVYEEEFGLRDAFRWSPDGSKIAYWQFDTRGVGTFYMINNTDSIYSRPIPLPYPKVGTTNSACKIGVVSSSGGETTWIEMPGDPRNTYIPRMDWAANSTEVVIHHLNRLQNTNTLYYGDVNSGQAEAFFVDQDEAWVAVHDDMKWLDGGKSFTWPSDRDGWLHLYRVSRDGKQVKLLTPGDYDIVSIEAIDDAGGWVYFIASPDNPTQRFLYRVSLNGDGKLERLTPKNLGGVSSYQVAPNGGWAIHTHSSFQQPPTVTVVKLPGHQSIKALQENSAMRTAVAKIERGDQSFFRIDIGDGIELDAWEIRPPKFDPSKKYPLFFFVYGEPASQKVLDKWGGRNYLWHLMLAQQGYVVISVDNRGTPGPRGRAWRKSIYEKIGIIASLDQAAAARVLLKKKSYLDANRVGIWGWSGGGSMTLNMLFRYPEIYKMGIAIAFVSNQRLYDTIYQERYMGLPSTNPDGYRDGSPITHAAGLQGDLLIIHGTGDDNVHYQSFEYLVNELIRLGKPFDMMAYPNRSHSIREGEGTTLHLYSLMTRYLYEHLPTGGQ